jgi:hypothetical protein
MMRFCFFQAQAPPSTEQTWTPGEIMGAMQVRNTNNGKGAGPRLVAARDGCFERNKSGPKPRIQEDPVEHLDIYRHTKLATGNGRTFGIDYMLSRMEFAFGNNIAYVKTPSTILGACKLLLKEIALKNGFPNIEAESTTRKHDGEIVGTSTMFGAKCILVQDRPPEVL